jgi:hypothetical protein
MLKKIFFASFQRIIELFTQKIVTKLLKIWVWDPRQVCMDLHWFGSLDRIHIETTARIQNNGTK